MVSLQVARRILIVVLSASGFLFGSFGFGSTFLEVSAQVCDSALNKLETRKISDRYEHRAYYMIRRYTFVYQY